MTKYAVEISRVSWGNEVIVVEASGIEEAKNKALGEVGNYSFSEHDAEYEIVGLWDYESPYQI